MTQRPLALGAIVLAAGAASRFSAVQGAKLVAELEGRPVLVHVLEAVRDYGPVTTVVVIGMGAEQVQGAIGWTAEARVLNRTPEQGLGSSIQVGIRALGALREPLDGAFVVLGDQPRLSADVMRALAHAAARARPADRPFVVPRYVDDPGPRNPVLVLRPAWMLVEELHGDRGFASLMEKRPDQVLEVPVRGSMPDVDEPADLERLR